MSVPVSPSEFLTSREVAELLRVQPRKIYDLAARGAIPCRRVTGKLLFPRAEIDAWLDRGGSHDPAIAAPADRTAESIATRSRAHREKADQASAAHDSTPRGVAGKASSSVDQVLPCVIAGSHDPLLEWAIRESGSMLATRFDGSLAGLSDLLQSRAFGAGVHVFDRDSKQWNTPSVQIAPAAADCVLIEWAWRQQGLIIAPDQEHRITSVADLAGCRVVRRQPASGARLLLDHLLAESGIAQADVVWVEPCARTEADAAAVVAAGKASSAPGLLCMAARFSLGFVPTRMERFDLLLKRREYFEPGMQKLLAFARSPQFRDMADELGGYDVTGLGRVVWNSA